MVASGVIGGNVHTAASDAKSLDAPAQRVLARTTS